MSNGHSIVVEESRRIDAGSCSFCNRPHDKVWVVRGIGQSSLEARFCVLCKNEFFKQVPTVDMEFEDLKTAIRINGIKPDPESVGEALHKLEKLKAHAAEAIRGFKSAGVQE